MVCGLFMILLLWGELSTGWLLSWLGILFSSSSIRLLISRHYSNTPYRPESYRFYKLAYIGGAFVSGLIWSSSNLFLSQVTDQSLQFGIILIMAGITAGAISSNAVILAGYYIFQIPVLAGLVAWLLSQPTPIHNKLAVLTLFYAGTLIVLAKKYRDHLVMAYKAEDKNKLLIEQLSATNIVLRDQIDSRAASEEALRKSELRFRNIIEAAPDAMIMINEAGDIVLINQETSNLFGYSEAELIGKKIEILVPARFKQHSEIRKKYLEKSAGGKFTIYPALYGKHKDGYEIPVEIRLNTVPFDDGIYISASIRDISKFLKIEDELRLATNLAEKANQAKSDFMRSMNHELRTPLNAIMGFSQILLLADNMTTEQSEQLTEINHAGKHMLKLINDMQDISRIESGQVELQIETISLAEILHDCLAFTSPLADKRHIKIELLDSVFNDCFVHADKTRLKQVILNLLTNAIKYNTENGSVSIHCSQTGDRHIRISITDTGQGFTTEQLAMLYQPFNRLGAENTEIEGTGIGLAISKKLIEIMDGDIRVETNPGFGSTFSIDLPGAEDQSMSDSRYSSLR